MLTDTPESMRQRLQQLERVTSEFKQAVIVAAEHAVDSGGCPADALEVDELTWCPEYSFGTATCWNDCDKCRDQQVRCWFNRF